jgi:hypothetical protein
MRTHIPYWFRQSRLYAGVLTASRRFLLPLHRTVAESLFAWTPSGASMASRLLRNKMVLVTILPAGFVRLLISATV